MTLKPQLAMKEEHSMMLTYQVVGEENLFSELTSRIKDTSVASNMVKRVAAILAWHLSQPSTDSLSERLTKLRSPDNVWMCYGMDSCVNKQNLSQAVSEAKLNIGELNKIIGDITHA